MSGDVGKVLTFSPIGAMLSKKKKDKEKSAEKEAAAQAAAAAAAKAADPYNLANRRVALPRKSFLASEQGAADGKSTVLGG